MCHLNSEHRVLRVENEVRCEVLVRLSLRPYIQRPLCLRGGWAMPITLSAQVRIACNRKLGVTG